MTQEEKIISGFEFSAKLGRAALNSPYQYTVPEMAKANMEFLCAELEKAAAQCRYMSGLLNRVMS